MHRPAVEVEREPQQREHGVARGARRAVELVEQVAVRGCEQRAVGVARRGHVCGRAPLEAEIEVAARLEEHRIEDALRRGRRTHISHRLPTVKGTSPTRQA